jgi:hypothetical protein
MELGPFGSAPASALFASCTKGVVEAGWTKKSTGAFSFLGRRAAQLIFGADPVRWR